MDKAIFFFSLKQKKKKVWFIKKRRLSNRFSQLNDCWTGESKPVFKNVAFSSSKAF